MKISVCIPTLRDTTLEHAVRSIKAQTYQDWELTVVGQGGNAGLGLITERVAAGDSRIRYLHLERCGASLARNAGMRVATGEIFAFTDDDCEADPGWLSTLAACFQAEPEVGLVGGAVVPPPTKRLGPSICPAKIPSESLYDPVASDRTPPPGWDWIGANHAIRREVAERVGDFDEHLGPGAVFPIAEDTDYKLRLEAMGVKMRATPRAIVRHTFGVRYGFGPRRRFARNYARGNGGFAGKLTLQGDPRGEQWVRATKAEWRQLLTRPHMLPAKVFRIRDFVQAYRQCLEQFEVEGGVLVPRDAEPVAARRDEPRLA